MNDEPIRARVWVIAAVPIGVVAATVVAMWPSSKETKLARVDATATTTVAAALPPPTIAYVEPRPSAPASAAPAPAPAPAPSASATPDASAVVEEKIPELQAFFNRPPPDSDEWSPEQKRAYRDRLFANLDDKERALERELAFAERRGDADAAAVKRATLARLRATRAKLEAGSQ